MSHPNTVRIFISWEAPGGLHGSHIATIDKDEYNSDRLLSLVESMILAKAGVGKVHICALNLLPIVE
ncbi:hypothetical protein DXZ20_21770 [Leptolyngbyaceae cyanobacterium CCMR0081]|uniref:Uncharacterized protein n=1 Tax=Adonisia turfae CCMR0081 TaxID=2292702 RepID=A0A6M0RR40_9CYAN|nr:hypothetical protein [Adonisia turfae CCMR0081]